MTKPPAPIPNAGEFGALLLMMLEAQPSRRPLNATHISTTLNQIGRRGDEISMIATVPDTHDDLSFAGTAFLLDGTAVDTMPPDLNATAVDPQPAVAEVRTADDDGNPTVSGSRLGHARLLRSSGHNSSPTGSEMVVSAVRRPSIVRQESNSSHSALVALPAMKEKAFDVSRASLPARGGHTDPWDQLTTRCLADLAPPPAQRPRPSHRVMWVILAALFALAAFLGVAIARLA